MMESQAQFFQLSLYVIYKSLIARLCTAEPDIDAYFFYIH